MHASLPCTELAPFAGGQSHPDRLTPRFVQFLFFRLLSFVFHGLVLGKKNLTILLLKLCSEFRLGHCLPGPSVPGRER